MTSPEAEVDLLSSFRDGDVRAFRQLVDGYQAPLAMYFRRLCQDRDRAEDLVQELFLRLVRGIDHYRTEGRMSVFIYRVARNLWIDHYRATQSRKRMRSYDQLADGADAAWRRQPAGAAAHPVQAIAEREELEALRGALARLPVKLRRTIEMAVYEQQPYAEIGRALGIPVGTVKSRVHTAVVLLKQALGEGKAAAPRRSGPAEVRPARPLSAAC